MNVCIITSWFPNQEQPHLAPFVYNFARNLGKSGIKLSVITVMRNKDQAVLEEDYMTVYRIKGKLSLLAMLSLVDKIKPEIIHVHAPNLFSSIAIVIAKLRGIPVMATVYRGEIDGIRNRPALSFLRKYALRRFDKIVALSNFSKSLALRAGAEQNKLTVIYNSCDEILFAPRDKLISRTKLNLPSQKRIILFVGNLIKLKGVYTLIESLRILDTKFQEFLVLIIGRGEEEDKIKSKLFQYGLSDKVSFLGWHPPEILPAFYNAADVFVLPSRVEGHSIALLEAMASGLPVVASDIEGNRESVEDRVNGLLFESGNEEMLAAKLFTILTNNELQNRMSALNPKIYSKKFSTRKQVENYSAVYQSLVKED